MELTPQNQHNSSLTPLIPFYDINLQLQEESFPTFNLEAAVCSHGFFLMSPNHWDPHSKTLLRPLRLSSSSSSSCVVRISSSLIRVYGRGHLSAEEEAAVVRQAKRMLRLSDREEGKVREFQELHIQAKEVGFGRILGLPLCLKIWLRLFFSAIAITNALYYCDNGDLYCKHCRWPRTLSMAKALCDLQLELQSQPSKLSEDALGTKSKVTTNGLESFTPRTPAIKEAQRKCKKQKILSEEVTVTANESISDCARLNSLTDLVPSVQDGNVDAPSIQDAYISESSGAFSEGRSIDAVLKTGNFPSPEELASLDEKYLAKRCGLGYRAGRILKLAQGVVEGRIQLEQLEEFSVEASLSNYSKVDEKLKEINGYGPFTHGNVLMCLGFYNVVPTDSETIRHLKQVHQKTTNIQNVQEVVEEMYRRYEPYQFLAYWWEIWSFYEGHFGKFSEMPSSDYKLITASNMRTKKKR